MYRALYPIVSKGAAPGCCSLPPDADGLLAPGSRRLRPSQSLYCMPSPQVQVRLRRLQKVATASEHELLRDVSDLSLEGPALPIAYI